MKPLVIEICLGTSCHLLGSQDLIAAIEELPPEQRDNVEVRGVTCLKACGKGPNIKVNGVVLSSVTPERLLEIVYDNL